MSLVEELKEKHGKLLDASAYCNYNIVLIRSRMREDAEHLKFLESKLNRVDNEIMVVKKLRGLA